MSAGDWGGATRPREGLPPEGGGLADGERRRDEVLESLGRAYEHWVNRATQVARTVPAAMELFTSEDVWPRLEQAGIEAPTEARAMGVVMKRLAQEGLARPTDRIRPATRPGREGAHVLVWESTVWGRVR